ncbi:hypothetical protein SAMN05660489_04542 [Pseudomonas sp. LAMO17WK12:I10]|jgi:hypothetical protein|uniref:hypothetical protein n=1 Tax=unclassified Pseudomonas TaxID=196821 RepID=UPI000BD080ED|nr:MULTISPECIES: hypothetical protein [unclassified Pseudomonas]PXX59517.1 hypothetical protein H160_04637 [Pseudomonas sp. LAMO17WK12:I9]SNY46690.1 hypothetical protein SAMN05660489_04542 [Pseudomonas sp. LAMO17WK12:I10]
MADIYDRAKASAARMLAPRSKGGKGLELSLLQIASGEYDPETGTGGETTTTFEGSGFRENYSLKDIDGSLIKQGDVKILVSPLLLDGTDTPKPTTQDKLVFDGETYTVQAVDPWSYAGLIVGFSVQARK